MVLLDLAYLFAVNGKGLNQPNQDKATAYFELVARLAGVLTTLLTELDEKLKPSEQQKFDCFVEMCYQFLGKAAFEQLMSESKLLPLEKVVTECLKGEENIS